MERKLEKKLVLENQKGSVVRTFNWQSEQGLVIYRKDLKRVEVWENETEAQALEIPYETLSTLNRRDLAHQTLDLGSAGHLRLLDFVENVEKDDAQEKEKSQMFWGLLLAFALLMLGTVITMVQLRPTETSEEKKEEMKIQIVKLIQKAKQPPQEIPKQMVVNQEQEKPIKPKDLSKNVKRLGALAVLGSLNNGKQKAGLNLGAVNTTAGAGLGGNAGSGGTQTSLYAKGIVAAPVGVGGNIQGAGGYGTKGKGGGQAGYGSLSLVGSAGTSTIPLGEEAIVEGGLDRDVIAAIVQKNAGQIRFCYEQGLQMEPSLAGRVVASWTINGQGTVSETSIKNTTMHSKTVEDCIQLRLRSWKFPLPKGGVNVKVSFPFVLNRTGSTGT